MRDDRNGFHHAPPQKPDAPVWVIIFVLIVIIGLFLIEADQFTTQLYAMLHKIAGIIGGS